MNDADGLVQRTNKEKEQCFKCGIDKCQFCSADFECESCFSEVDEEGVEQTYLPDPSQTECLLCSIEGCAVCDEPNKCMTCSGEGFEPTLDRSKCVRC